MFFGSLLSMSGGHQVSKGGPAVRSGSARRALKRLRFTLYLFVFLRRQAATVNDCQLISLQRQKGVFGLCCSVHDQ